VGQAAAVRSGLGAMVHRVNDAIPGSGAAAR
jgi:hypothetical protein